MLSLSASPVEYSSLEADELSNVSDDEDFDADDPGEEEELEDGKPLEGGGYSDRFIKPRFKVWASQLSGRDEVQQELLQELLQRVVVSDYDLETISSERVFSLGFRLASLECRYAQRSHADVTSATWDADTLEVIPNMQATLIIDDETVLGARSFVSRGGKAVPKLETEIGGAVSSSALGVGAVAGSRRWVNGPRLSEMLGTENTAKLGGLPVLLQFLGVLCADSGAPVDYVEALPFGLAAELVKFDESSGKTGAKDKAALASSPKRPKPKQLPSGRPSSRGPARPPSPGATAATASSTARSFHPRNSSQGRQRP